ncbi:hypothetical protein [Streptomyces sp. RFCAC02]|uniref:DUF4097 family beta strand repeat-containing protein n=1 Tax=Streptomyces sp. RFCAC02 TaxID=2499143 RepID=UPI0010207BA5|nr:hypothetical protein [Streptomyces sp. RFCAC02]
MAPSSEWSVTGPQSFDFDGKPVAELHIGLVGGAVNVVGTDTDTTRVEIAEVTGPPLRVRRRGGRLSVSYGDLSWKSFLDKREYRGTRSAVVSVSVPAACRLTVGVVDATAVVSGLAGDTEVRAVTGDTTLVGPAGTVRVRTVSGDADVQGFGGELRFSSAAGDLTVLDGAGTALEAETVSGGMVVDLAPRPAPSRVRLKSVTGEVAVRLPEGYGAEVSAESLLGALSSDVPGLAPSGWGPKRLRGTIGRGGGSLRCVTVSGAVALLRRPDTHEAASALSFRKDA